MCFSLRFELLIYAEQTDFTWLPLNRSQCTRTIFIVNICPLLGYKIPQIENMGATLDQFDTIDFSDNDLRRLDGFPFLPRMKCLLLNNNRIV